VELIFSHVFKNLFQLSLVIRIRRATSALAFAASPRRNRLRRKVVPRISTKSRVFEQTVAIELEKRARLGEFSLKLCVGEAFVLVFPAVKRHSMRERERGRSEGFSSDFKILASNQIITSGFFASTVTRRRRRRRRRKVVVLGITAGNERRYEQQQQRRRL
jgi:hypothetical protein